MNRLKFSPQQRRRLERQLNETRDARLFRRTLALLKYSRGRAVTDIAALLKVTRQSVHHWIAAYAHTRHPRALADAPRSGRPCVWSPQRQARLCALLQTTPDRLGYFAVNWTVPLLAEQIAHETGQRLSDDTIRRELERQHYVWKRFRYVLDPDADQEKKTLSAAAPAGVASHPYPAD